ncbi:bifunctional 3,4-dihydroxy-2-butanone 4-phosphate synthase/GTP cyclohydrolase II protein [Corynebacterium kutscheri]|uniref:Riboflavin biosynthesis protein RibBA n=1 Tax=Corynebacterium kutscheri TaxID=35755 RepID=A0A0F6TCZ6_9CORY|nr:bifunctional 3,4-dihydroxy-2-butanone-4-phosphate synthase/GTP cyclohydrolase II [Corynebacterium kutscheri]AKE41291.1 GTP cyclohydrolase II/3,4-dihydroxy-2-butanone 4-phosphate synthase [Corynebacterium kutscheri]VEH08567.1 bifunctional 3,4-dihydroxy-2-butanone 4-phosphate synthase/GTP cyclohydrolase II protein [Corynebacterium kutscheri]VEH09613.1 bifunctional 3,4-dihydroxy-2-butanone 4-phosphate synthase/GTP cyclohydrolase II protein [Corynebacterium kutscheri]VEH79696.1 bifunctional 3,4-
MNLDEDTPVRLDSVADAIADIAAGKAVVVVDNENRENEGDIIFAAEKATPELVAFMVRYSSGYICAPLLAKDCDRLGLPAMTAHNQDARNTAYTITVDANTGTTGISATSRAETLRRLANPASIPSDFTRPGHVVPLRAREGGVLVRDGHTEAAVDLARLAGLYPAGVLCEVVSEEDPTDMARSPELRRFSDAHGLKMISIEQLQEYRRGHETQIERVVETRLPTQHGEFRALGYRSMIDGVEHVALVKNELSTTKPVLVRVHSECLTGDVFSSERCDCGAQLHAGMSMVNEAGSGVIIYLRGQEGRGIGLLAKLQAYVLQDGGTDTVDANLELGLPAEAREYSVAAQILKDLGVTTINLISNNPHKVKQLENYGIKVADRIPSPANITKDNYRYLATKRDRMGHDLPWLADFPENLHQ